MQLGYKPGESVISIFTGLGIQPGQLAKGGGISIKPRYDEQFLSVLSNFTGLFGALVVCDPLIAKALKEQGYETKEKLIDWLYKNAVHTVREYKDASFVLTFDLATGSEGDRALRLVVQAAG